MQSLADRAWAQGYERTAELCYSEMLVGGYSLPRCGSTLLGEPFDRHVTECLHDGLGDAQLWVSPDERIMSVPYSRLRPSMRCMPTSRIR